jgi:hypothetical protein
VVDIDGMQCSDASRLRPFKYILNRYGMFMETVHPYSIVLAVRHEEQLEIAMTTVILVDGIVPAR